MVKRRFKSRLFQTTGRVLTTAGSPRTPPSPASLPASYPKLRDGELFDDTYRLVRLIGEGAMGAVYEATHARLAGRYAIKVLLLKPTVNSETISLFSREARITSLLQHPNIVQVIDHNTTPDGSEYLVMEYLDGESLAQRLSRQGALPLEVVVGIVDQIAAGLAAAHAYRIVHRDLKPDNVFLVPVKGREEESVKILDFGISKVKGASWGRQAPEGTVMGTPLYMAPEQIEGRVADADASTDQFALAVMAYEMLTGRNPFQANSVEEIFALVLSTDPAPMGLGRDVELVIRRGLAKANIDRFSSITDFSDALRAAAEGRRRDTQWAATLAYAAGEIASHDNKGRLGRRLFRLGLALGVVASISVAFVLGGRMNHRRSLVEAAPPPRPTLRLAEQADDPPLREKHGLDAATATTAATAATAEPEADEESNTPEGGAPPTERQRPPRQVHRRSASTSGLHAHEAAAAYVDGDATLAPSENSR